MIEQVTFKEKLRCMPFIILIGLIIYVLCEQTGIANQIGSDVDPATEIKETYTHEIVTETIYTVTVLKGSHGKEVKIFEGAMKKTYLDTLEFVGMSQLVFEGKLTDSFVNSILTDLAEGVGANVVIIDNKSVRTRAVTKTVSPWSGGF